MYIVSACLCGVNCKYSGGNNLNEKVLELLKNGEAVLVCPEQLGGLSTPRCPCEIVAAADSVKVMSRDGDDTTENYLKGAYETLKIAKLVSADKAILKAKSPSCGVKNIYDGTFSGTLKEGMGITAKLLSDNGIEVISDDDF